MKQKQQEGRHWLAAIKKEREQKMVSQLKQIEKIRRQSVDADRSKSEDAERSVIERISIEREKRRSKRNNKPIALKQGSEGDSIIKPPEEYLYKKLQDDFQRVTASREQDRLMKALEE